MSHEQLPLFEIESSWKPPKELPNLSAAKCIGLDTETYDKDLKTKGPGVRRDGYMVGISVAVPEGNKWYLPFAHSTGDQLEKENVMKWAKDNLCRSNQPKIGTNLLYDLDYLYYAGVKVTGPFYDISLAEPLIDENKGHYSLDSLALEYLGIHKEETLLKEACLNFQYKGTPQAHIWKLDPKYVGPYAEADALQPMQIFEKQKKILKEQDLEEVFDIETRLVPMLLHMRQLGVPINTTHLLELRTELKSRLKDMAEELGGINIWAAESIARVLDKENIPYPRTPKTNKPSFTKAWLSSHDNHLIQTINKARELDKFCGTFIDHQLLDMMVDNRIHCQFNQLRSDDSGTVTGRFSGSRPNLQFIPARTADGARIRQAFIPDDGYHWCKADYSQIEIRILAHYARGEGAKEVVQAFNNDPRLDYHQWCAMKSGKSRRDAKTINFGIIYGMGVPSLAVNLGQSIEEATGFIKMYNEALPFLNKTTSAAAEEAYRRALMSPDKVGYIKTISGRRRRFTLWESSIRKIAKSMKPMKDTKALLSKLKKLGARIAVAGIKPAYLYKAFNAVDQGSAADVMKASMVNIWESGLCEIIKPYITVHDELDFGYPEGKAGWEAMFEVKRIMEKELPWNFKVPIITDLETGPNWGELKSAE